VGLPRPYRDGRYRVREYACLEGGWRDVVVALACRANAVLMDLRDFTRDNTGCIFEIEALMSTVGPSGVVFVVDATTDTAALREILRTARSRAGVDPARAARIVLHDLSALKSPLGDVATVLALRAG
jgi:hypothetical protein